MSTVVIVPKYARVGEGFSRRERLQAQEHPGRRTDGSQTPASWVLDLADSNKLILLCAWCRAKFNPRRHGYRRFYTADPTSKTDGYLANGRCDACKSRTELQGGGVAFVREDTYRQVCENPLDARRQARRAWKSESVWTAVSRAITRVWGNRRPPEAPVRRMPC